MTVRQTQIRKSPAVHDRWLRAELATEPEPLPEKPEEVDDIDAKAAALLVEIDEALEAT